MVGNANIGLAGIAAWVYVAGRNSMVVPLAAAALLNFKTTYGAIGSWIGRERRFRHLVLGAGGALIVASLASFLTGGISAWLDYLAMLRNVQPDCSSGWTLLSVICWLTPVTGVPLAKLIAIAAAIAVGLLALAIRRDHFAFAAATLAILIPVGDFHNHYLALVYVAALVLLLPAVDGRPRTAPSHRRSPNDLDQYQPAGGAGDGHDTADWPADGQ
jgi:hypothetical protein